MKTKKSILTTISLLMVCNVLFSKNNSSSRVLKNDSSFVLMCSATKNSIMNQNSNLTTIWNGTTWSNGIPDASTDAIISGNYTATTDLTANTLTVNNGAIVVVTSGYSFFITSTVTVSLGASLTFETNANLIQTEDINTNSGNIIVKRNSSPLKRLDYLLWSSPVASQNLQSFSTQTLANRFYTYNPTSNAYNAIATPASTSFEAGKGILIRTPNTFSDTTPTVWSGRFEGVPNNGDYNIPVTSNAYNSIGNPYPSPIDADMFMLTNNITEAIYFWRKTNNSANSSYATYTVMGGVSNKSGLSAIEPNRTIDVGQGFIVKATSNTVAFNNAMRVSNNNNQLLKTLSVERHRIWINLANENFPANQMLLGYMTNATNGVDPGIDGTYINDSQIALNSYLNNGEFIVQGRSLPFTNTDVVPLTFKTTIAGNYTISIDHVDGLFLESQNIYIKDNLMGITHDLKQSPYAFVTATGVFNTRFEIVYATASQLGTTNPVLNENNVIVFNQNNILKINTGTNSMKSVRLFDIQGKLIKEQNAINASTTEFKDLQSNGEVLIAQITSDQGIVITKKVIF